MIPAHNEWTGKSCPFCGAGDIEFHGTDKGEDSGDDGSEHEKWACNICGEVWQSDKSNHQNLTEEDILNNPLVPQGRTGGGR